MPSSYQIVSETKEFAFLPKRTINGSIAWFCPVYKIYVNDNSVYGTNLYMTESEYLLYLLKGPKDSKPTLSLVLDL